MLNTLLSARSYVGLALALAVLATTMGVFQDGGSAPPAVVAAPDGRVIDEIRFEGNRASDSAYLATVVRIAPGAVWKREEIAAACARLAETGKFEGSPFAEPREEEGRLIAVFVVVERPFITSIDFIGNKKFKSSELLKEIELSTGSPISEYLVQQARQTIERKYKEAGFAHATVDVDRNVLASEQRALFQITEGPRIKVRKILFEGANSYSPMKLNSKIETSTYIWLLRTGAFDDETAQRDVAALKKFYNDRGYLNAQVGYRVELADNQSDLTLIFQVEEGQQHLIKDIAFAGNTVFSNDQILAQMKSGVGRPIDADELKEDRDKLTAEYGRIGYIYADVQTNYVFDEMDGFVNLKVSVTEKAQYRFGRIQIRGNRRTKDKVVRRELRFFPEELYNTVAAKEAENRLVESRLFSEATITPQGELPGVRDALIDVAEADTTEIRFGVGVTTNNGLTGSIMLENRNFDLFDWPRNSSELFKGKAFKGAGQTMRILIEPGTEVNRGRIDFREPYLLDKDLGFGTGFYVFQRDRDEYNEERIGFYTSLDKRFREGILKGWAAEISPRFEYIDISDVEFLSARDIEKAKGSSWLTSLKGTLVHDRTDSAWLPSTGDKLKVSYEQAGVFGGDWVFGKAIGEYEKYFTLYKDSFDRKHILQVGASAGQIFGDAPVFERFYAGGIGSIRGFEFRGISPRDGIRNDRVGGDFMFLTNVEYSFPVVGKLIRGVTFLDMGTVEEDFGINSWRAAVGVGARVYIKYFGPIPLAFDLAFPIAKDNEDDEQVFSFSFGTTF